MENNYEIELGKLAGQVGSRNSQLLRLALLGVRAGRDPETLQGEIIAAGGEPRLTDSEVRRAVDKALRQCATSRKGNAGDKTPRTLSRLRGRSPSQSLSQGPNKREIGFVREMIDAGKGATSRDLMELSRSTFHELWISEDNSKIRVDIGVFLKRIFKSGELIFTGTPLTPRKRENLKTLEQLIDELSRRDAPLPTHFIPNPFTGEPGKNSEGKISYCLDSTVAHRRMALIEFDELPLKEQAAFWMGAIKTRLLPVRSLVYSGGKSIHGLIELAENNRLACLRDTAWEEQWRKLERLICSDPDSAYRADRACKNVSRLTRFPEAIRPDTHKRQRLLW